ncbi:The (Largely Archaeal Putative) Hydrophobe/Amphiphile Efflux-3 (HAE3) Family [Archaeoglobus sulfaticallidus PM70-1]|uniref:The (Largely Archaeal Putative) Hydrophobe/Amphiphile Efflux-3 (HAE3) Family n=2 Tax=Archaeoglobus TaxID=2233 RepID=N0BK53_9EURY|nr:The (Largely Archaeal Putative) Hydrophobe/Amphiphile Efflux-3 (HAE3) Family [Archaeoglobus sulfaticallidus PM70-1]
MFQEFLENVARFVARKPGLVVSVVSLLIILSAISAQNVKLTSGTESMFNKDNVVYKQYELYQKDFGTGTQNIFIIVKGDEVVSTDVYRYMLDLQRSLEYIDGVSGTLSPASIIVEIVGYLPPDEAQLMQLTERYARDLAPEKTMTLIFVHLATNDKEKQNEISKEVERVVETSHPPAGLRVEVTGIPALNVQIQEEIKKSFGVTMAVSTVLMVLILFLTFSGVVRRKYTALMPLMISVVSVQTVYGLMPILGIPLSEHTNGALPMLIGLAIEYGAQLQNRYEEERKEGRDKDESIVISITRTGVAIVMALITTVIGFMSMLAPGIPSMAQFGIIASLGLIMAYIFTLTFLPAILKLIDREKTEVRAVEKEKGILERSLAMISSLTATRPVGILVFAFAIVVFGLYASSYIQLETNYNKYVPQDLPAMQRFNELERVVGGQAIYTLVLNTDEVSAKTLEDVDELSQYIVSREDLVYDYSSVTKVIKEVRAAYGRDGIPESDAELSYILDSLPQSELKQYISGNLIAVHFYTNADSQDEYERLYESIKRDVQYFGWSGGYYVTGSPVIYAEMGNIMINGQTTMTLTAYALIVILLLVVYRSIRKAVVPLIAITTVIGVMNTIMYLTGTKHTMISIALNSITLGLGIDFSIHVLERYFEERQSYSPIESVRRTIERTGKAITTSALTMAGGFGSLMFSSFPIMQSFGFIALIAIVFSLISALTVVPAFLMVTEKIKVGSNLAEIKNFASNSET